MHRRTLNVIGRSLCVLFVGLLGVTACGGTGGDDAADGATVDDTTGAAGTTTMSTGDPASDTTGEGDTSTDPASSDNTETSAAEVVPTDEVTFPTVTSEIVGRAVGGNSGGIGEGETDTFSETVRNEDGSCSGRAGPNGGGWTEGLEAGAPVVFLAADADSEIGTGQIGTSSYEDVDPGGNEQWVCTFEFTGTIEGAPDRFRMRVADLEPWAVSSDPSVPTEFFASVNTVVDASAFPSCVTPPDFLTEVQPWRAVGTYWSVGIPSLCDAGLTIGDVQRGCRPPGVGSDYIMAVTSVDSSVVYEDGSGLLVEPAELALSTPVAVQVATGRPC